MKKESNPAPKRPRRWPRRLALACIVTAAVTLCAAGLVTVDRNTRRTGLSHAPALVAVEEPHPRQYRLEVLGGRFTLTIRLPDWIP